MRKRIIAVFTGALVILTVGTFAVVGQAEQTGQSVGACFPAIEFQDVSGSDWFAPAVQYAAENELMHGIGENRFDPRGTMSRAMFAAVLARMSGVDLNEYQDDESAKDVPADSWYHDYVAWAIQEGVIEENDGLFTPSAPITRELAARAMMQLYWLRTDYLDFGWYDVDYGNIDRISDQASISEDALESVRWAMAVGLMQGDGTRFDPQGTLTRAQAAQILTNYHKREKRVRNEAPKNVLDQTIKSGGKTYTIRMEKYSRLDDARGNLLISENGKEFRLLGDPDLIYGESVQKDNDSVGIIEETEWKVVGGWMYLSAFDPVEYQFYDHFESPVYRINLSTGETEIAESGKLFELEASQIRQIRFGNGNTGIFAKIEDPAIIQKVTEILNGFRYDTVKWDEGGAGWHHNVSLIFQDGSQQSFLVEPEWLRMSGPLGSAYWYTASDKSLKPLTVIISDYVGE